jgi:hypothetical protein
VYIVIPDGCEITGKKLLTDAEFWRDREARGIARQHSSPSLYFYPHLITPVCSRDNLSEFWSKNQPCKEQYPTHCLPSGLLKCISELSSPFYQFGLLVVLASAWSLTWYQSPGSRVRVLVFAIYCKIAVAPLCVHVLTFFSHVCVHVLTFSSPVTREWGCWSV